MKSLPLYQDQREKLLPIMGVPPNLSDPIVGCPFSPRCEYVTKQCKEKHPICQQPFPHHYSCCIHIDKLRELPSILEYPI
jgi:oligopeptide/dipeptide ABC transporter ATP-binding protein